MNSELMGNESQLRIEIKNTQPVELIDLTESLLSLGNQYKKFIVSHPEFGSSRDVKLYVKEIRAGSIITDLVSLTPLMLAVAERPDTVIEFAKFMKEVFDFLMGKLKQSPALDKGDLSDFSKIIEPVAKDNGGQINVSGIVNGDVTVNVFNFSSIEANAVQNSIRRQLDSFKESQSNTHNQVVMYWFQARGDTTSNTGDKGIIESISPKPVKVLFDNENIKSKIMLGEENPFRYGYIVDVLVETIEGKPAAYKILYFHNTVDRPT